MEDSTNVTQTGFFHEQRDDGIIVYRLTDLRRETVDDFIEVMERYKQSSYRAGRHNRSMMDVSELSMPTPYAAKRIQVNIESTPSDLRTSYAVVTPTSLLYTFARTVINRIPKRLTGHIRFFNTEHEAIIWLEQRLEELGP